MKTTDFDNQQKLTPLWIVAIFVSFAEAISGGALISTLGDVQLILTYFVVIFPSGVAVGFFILLYKKNWVFYSPSEFRTLEILEAYQSGSKPLTKPDFEKLIKEGVHGTVDDSQIEQRIFDNIKKQVITVDPSNFLKDGTGTWVYPYDQFNTVQQLLNNIWNALPRDKVSPFSYGKEWVLLHAKTNTKIEDIGANSKYVRSRGESTDDRTLDQVGIRPGAELVIVKP